MEQFSLLLHSTKGSCITACPNLTYKCIFVLYVLVIIGYVYPSRLSVICIQTRKLFLRTLIKRTYFSLLASPLLVQYNTSFYFVYSKTLDLFQDLKCMTTWIWFLLKDAKFIFLLTFGSLTTGANTLTQIFQDSIQKYGTEKNWRPRYSISVWTDKLTYAARVYSSKSNAKESIDQTINR